MKTLKLTLAVLTSISIASVTALALSSPQRGPIPFDTYDVNKDGSISENEFYDARTARMTQKAEQGMPMKNAGNAPEFSAFDTNKDGKLTKLELLEGQMKQMQKNKANKGQGNKSQMKNKMKGMGRNMPTFKDFDSNNDGYLTETEMNEFRAKRMEEKASQGKMMKNSGNQTSFSDIDANNDGKVSKEEFMSNHMKKRAQ